jgi:hypothetical protein
MAFLLQYQITYGEFYEVDKVLQNNYIEIILNFPVGNEQLFGLL